MKLNLNQATITACRKHAEIIANDIQAFIDHYTTVSVERSILRFLGIDGVNALDVPYVNVITDHLIDEADLSLGVAHYLSHAIENNNLSPQLIAEAIAEDKLSLKHYQELPTPNFENLKPYIDKALQKITNARQYREERLAKIPKKTTPELYVIVATGNIYEDIEQALSAAHSGADIIAVIRTTGQSLLDFVPYGATTEGFGGTMATQENFKLMRKALDEFGEKHQRYIKLVNYASGLCMPEIAAIGAFERLDMMLNDSLYGIIFRDINMQRTFIDQYFSRLISAYAGITINTGEDNYLTTSDAYEHAHTVLASQFINEQFAKKALMEERFMGLGHAYEIDPNMENSFLYELAQAELSKAIFPNAPLKYMPPTKHMTGDIFKGYIQNALFNIVAVTSEQSIHLLGMLTEAIHTPFMSDRALAIDNAQYIAKAFKDFSNEISYRPDGLIMKRANTVLKEASNLLTTIQEEGLFTTLEKGRFAGISRRKDGGKGLPGVFKKAPNYHNPVMETLIHRLKEAHDEN